ncbi:hypothetical protein JRQ81_008955 [Phrynocephalus forsythii]|uniref:Uncharacterized protein n=1 Tax=Phrynocephalus forsythii TaxID=171643 RepID=A0A9Q0Y477_9SAUR|nr:hypothetical protein JRQ81_008955 [Phrynocephalus forsythii]
MDTGVLLYCGESHSGGAVSRRVTPAPWEKEREEWLNKQRLREERGVAQDREAHEHEMLWKLFKESLKILEKEAGEGKAKAPGKAEPVKAEKEPEKAGKKMVEAGNLDQSAIVEVGFGQCKKGKPHVVPPDWEWVWMENPWTGNWEQMMMPRPEAESYRRRAHRQGCSYWGEHEAREYNCKRKEIRQELAWEMKEPSHIYLEYEGTDFVEWDISILCSVEDASSPQTTMICSVAGTHKIMPVVGTPTFEDRERYLTVSVDLNCFLWYDYSIQSSSTITKRNNKKDLIIWIYDPENADSSEVDRIASKPPTYSRALSKQFSNLGQIPAIKTYFRDIEFTDAQFMDEGFWKIHVNTGLDDIIAHIHGKTITFQGCFVAPSPIVIPEAQTLFRDLHEISISSPRGSDTRVFWAACFPTTAVLLTDVGAFWTTNGFQTTEEITFPSTVLDRAVAHLVHDVAIVIHYVFFLIDDVVYVSDKGDFFRADEDYDFPENGVIGIRSRTWCELIYPEADTILTVLLVWTERVIYLISASHEQLFMVVLVMDVETLKKIFKFRKDVDLTIINACYDSVPSEVSVLVACVGCISTRTFYLAAYNEEKSMWFLRDFSLPAATVKAMDIEVIPSARSAMVLWDDDQVYYTYKANRVNGYMMVAGTDKILSAASDGTTIHQIIIDFDGNTVIKMKNNMLFFLKFNMKDVIRLNLWENESKHFVLYLNPLSDLYLLTVNDSNIVRQTYPLKIEIFSATYALNEVCPYISFQHSVKLNVHYVDKGENVTFWTQIVFLENLGLSTEVTINRADLLKHKSDLQYEIARGICTKNETTIFFQDHDYSKDEKYQEAILDSEGVLAIDLRPSATGRTCLSNNKLFFIVIGCSPYRHIDVERPSSCKKENFIVSIPEKYLWIHTHGSPLI